MDASAPPVRLYSLRDCVLLTLRWYLSTVAVGAVAGACSIYFFNDPALREKLVAGWLKGFYLLLPVLILTGVYQGRLLYRMATAQSDGGGLLGCLLWIPLLAIGHVLVLLLPPQGERRRQILTFKTPLGHRAATGYALLAVLYLSLPGRVTESSDSVLGLVLQGLHSSGMAFVLVLFADCFATNAIATLQRGQRLAPPDSQRLQFTTGSLLLLSVAFGAWLTGLNWIVR